MIGDKFTYKYNSIGVPKEKINYSYSKYGGEDFVDSYKKSRESISLNSITCESSLFIPKTGSFTESLFIKWIDCLNNNELNYEELNLLLKRFEVTKKIYNEYDENFRPINNKVFEELHLYVLFSHILVLAYDKTKKLQYLNSLLKVNDINISVFKDLVGSEIGHLKYCIQKELDFVFELRSKLL